MKNHEVKLVFKCKNNIFTSLYCIIIITRSSRILKQITWLFLFLFFYYVLPWSTFSYNYFYLHGIYSCTTNAISILKTFYICFYYARNHEAAEQYGFIPANQQRSGYATDNDIIACNQSAVTWGISHLSVLSGNWVFLPPTYSHTCGHNIETNSGKLFYFLWHKNGGTLFDHRPCSPETSASNGKNIFWHTPDGSVNRTYFVLQTFSGYNN